MIIQVYLTKFGTIQSMKVQNLKQPFMLQAIVTIFGESFFFLEICWIFFLKWGICDRIFFQNVFYKMAKLHHQKNH
jgi:plastocyanin domain-containing protein